jgi:hypothetical protein
MHKPKILGKGEFNQIPVNNEATFIAVTRDPKNVAVSPA